MVSIYPKGRFDDSVQFEFLEKEFKEEREQFIKTQKDKPDQFSYTESELRNDLKQGLARLVKRNIILQGIRPKCRRCGYKNWYFVDEIAGTLICRGCSTQFRIPVEPRWFYKLNELVKNTMVTQGVIATLICLGQILNLSFLSFIYSPNLELTKTFDSEIPDAELDIVCVSDGKFIIGEAKNSAALFGPAESKKIRDIAIEIRPDKVVIFALKGPYEKAEKHTEMLKSELKPYGIDVKFMHPPDSYFHPEYHV